MSFNCKVPCRIHQRLGKHHRSLHTTQCLRYWCPLSPAPAVPCRVLKLIQRAPRSIRLVADPGPLHVVYEDAAFLAVLKPPGLRSAPVHRFLGGSALNRMIAYLGYEPHLLHRSADRERERRGQGARGEPGGTSASFLLLTGPPLSHIPLLTPATPLPAITRSGLT